MSIIMNGKIVAGNGPTIYSNVLKYDLNDLVFTISGDVFKLYKSLSPNNVGNAVTNPTYWKFIDIGSGIIITTLTDDSTITLTDNVIYNGSELATFEIQLPSSASVDFLCEIDFSSGSTATTITYPNTINWVGDDVTSNVFTPAVNKRYTIMFTYNGTGWLAVVVGV